MMFFSKKKSNDKYPLPALSFCSEDGKKGSLQVLDQWVNKLPIANPDATLNSIVEAIKELNGSNCTSGAFYSILSTLDSTIENCVQHRGGTGTHSKRQAYVTELLYRCADSCIAAIRDKEGIKGLPPEERLYLFVRGCKYLSKGIMRTFAAYDIIPKGSWLKLHFLYSHYMADSAIRSVKHEDTELGAEAYYKAILVVSASKPQQLKPAQVEALFNELLLHAENLATLKSPELGTTALVDTHSDSGARKYTAHIELPEQDGLYIAVSKLNESVSSSSLNSLLKNHFVSYWGSDADRKFSRVPSEGELEICIGISALHYFLAGEKQFADFIQRVAAIFADSEENRFTTTKNTKAQKRDVWDDIYSENWETAGIFGNSIEYKIDRNTNTASDKSKYKVPDIYRINIQDESPNGYRLISKLEEHPRPETAKPGEMVGIRHPQQENWHLGIIHWIQVNEFNWEMGVELLSPNPEPYALKVIKSKQDTDYLRAIVIPPINNTGENFTILMPNIGVSGKTAAILVNEYTKNRVILRDRVREIGEFSQHLLAK